MRSDGSLVAVGTTDTALAGPLLGGTDAIAMALKAGTGATMWQRQFGTADNDAASAVVSQPGGVVRVVGTTNGRLAPMVGDYDLFASTLSARGVVQASQQLGTAAVDGLDTFGEANLFAAGGRVETLDLGGHLRQHDLYAERGRCRRRHGADLISTDRAHATFACARLGRDQTRQ